MLTVIEVALYSVITCLALQVILFVVMVLEAIMRAVKITRRQR